MIALRYVAGITAALAIIAVGNRTDVLRNRSTHEPPRAAYEPSRCVVAWWALVAVAAYASNLPAASDAVYGPIGVIAAIALLTAIVVWAAADSEAKTHGFFHDLGSDRGEVALHTAQFIGWNALIGIMLAATTYRKRAVPQVGWELVALMGISAAFYIIFRTSRLGAPEPQLPRAK